MLDDYSWTLGPFTREDAFNPCLTPSAAATFECPVRKAPVAWEAKDVFNPAAVVRDGKVYLLYRAEDTVGRHAGTSRIGLAESVDGRTFLRRPEPVLYPDNDFMNVYEWEGGCEDPRIVEDDAGRYYLTYTAYDGRLARLAVAVSDDLVRWRKCGLAFANTSGGKYVDLWSKSGAIICRRSGERLIATRINGVYWMYWGESSIYLAQSDNLIDWEIIHHADLPNQLRAAFGLRGGRFDSNLVEPGPPALLTDAGIVFIYNSKNDATHGDPTLPPGTYAAGQVLLDPRDPSAVLRRVTSPFLQPERDYEITGQVGNVCFLEGLVYFKGEWLLYYGTADSKIALARAVATPNA
ncbi:MAG TPA: glycoside hydrolase family 130 protein [Roseiflexaceae bacterium]|nr:glycoside hydrolase family 130 protein [Roseiflexaceae bacterium]